MERCFLACPSLGARHMATAIHPGRSLCCAMCYPVFHIVSGDLRMALILHLVQLVEAVRGERQQACPGQRRHCFLFCRIHLSQPQLYLYCGEHFQCIPASSTFSLGFGLSSWRQSEVWESCLRLTWTNYLRTSVTPITLRKHISLLHKWVKEISSGLCHLEISLLIPTTIPHHVISN